MNFAKEWKRARLGFEWRNRANIDHSSFFSNGDEHANARTGDSALCMCRDGRRANGRPVPRQAARRRSPLLLRRDRTGRRPGEAGKARHIRKTSGGSSCERQHGNAQTFHGPKGRRDRRTGRRERPAGLQDENHLPRLLVPACSNTGGVPFRTIARGGRPIAPDTRQIRPATWPSSQNLRFCARFCCFPNLVSYEARYEPRLEA